VSLSYEAEWMDEIIRDCWKSEVSSSGLVYSTATEDGMHLLLGGCRGL
jgi:hypothetical protein